jgi:putative iron-only hydrogenase system regulator
METKYQTLTITIYDRDLSYKPVSELLHHYADKIVLRTGYPIPDKNAAIIFIILQMTNDDLGALSGKLGLIKSVKVKATTLNL